MFAPLLFAGKLFTPQFFVVLEATVAFSILTSSVYLINDIIDIRSDQNHPVKKNRPIAAGIIPVPVAVFIALCGFCFSLWLAINLSFFFFLVEIAYLCLQVAYTFTLKKIIIIDVLSIAAGFILRVYAGAIVINSHMSVWFLLCVVSLSLFLAVGKRRSEIQILTGKTPGFKRKTLNSYNISLLDSYLAIFANSAWMSYALFTFFSPPATTNSPFLALLPQTLAGINKWLMATVPVVIYGVMRYVNIIYTGGNKAEAPERVLLSDKPLLISVGIWAIMLILIIYGL